MKRRCPHDDVVLCPLYLAAHGVEGFGCSIVDPDRCDAAGGYTKAIERMAKTPEGREYIFGADMNRQRREQRLAAEQRQRNLRAAGLH